MSKIGGIFSNRDSPSTSGKQPRAMAVASIVWGRLLDSPDQQVERFLMTDKGIFVSQIMAVVGNNVTPSDVM